MAKSPPTSRRPLPGTAAPDEVARFSALAEEWWDADGKFRPLHRINPLRIAFIRDRVAGHFDRDPLGADPLGDLEVLDIGCGWGAFARHASANHGVRVTGISPAGEQVDEARRRAGNLSVEFHQQDYRDVEGEFDRIVSIGMMEHVGPRNFGTFFDRCRDLLVPDGLMLHHTIGSNESKDNTDAWFDRYIFPGGVVPSLHQIAGASQPHWTVEDVQNLGPDYDRTLLAWHDNIEARWHEIPDYDERFRRTWRYYLLSSAASFRVRNLQVFQVMFRRTARVSPRYDAAR